MCTACVYRLLRLPVPRCCQLCRLLCARLPPAVLCCADPAPPRAPARSSVFPPRSRDYTAAEREQGLHRAILNWASESRSNRGFKDQLAKLSADLTEKANTATAV